MKHFLIILTIFIACQFSYAQESDLPIVSVKKSLSDTDFLIAEKLYLKMCSSELYNKQREASLTFVVKLGKMENWDLVENDESFFKWISENLRLTQFKDIEEAIELRKLCFELQEKLEKENNEVFELINSASVDQLKEILKPERLTSSEMHQ
jgi:hypothetical protein